MRLTCLFDKNKNTNIMTAEVNDCSTHLNSLTLPISIVGDCLIFTFYRLWRSANDFEENCIYIRVCG